MTKKSPRIIIKNIGPVAFKQKNKLSIYNLQIKFNWGRGFFKKTPVPLTKKFLVYIKILLFEHVKDHTFDAVFC